MTGRVSAHGRAGPGWPARPCWRLLPFAIRVQPSLESPPPRPASTVVPADGRRLDTSSTKPLLMPVSVRRGGGKGIGMTVVLSVIGTDGGGASGFYSRRCAGRTDADADAVAQVALFTGGDSSNRGAAAHSATGAAGCRRVRGTGAGGAGAGAGGRRAPEGWRVAAWGTDAPVSRRTPAPVDPVSADPVSAEPGTGTDPHRPVAGGNRWCRPKLPAPGLAPAVVPASGGAGPQSPPEGRRGPSSPQRAGATVVPAGRCPNRSSILSSPPPHGHPT